MSRTLAWLAGVIVCLAFMAGLLLPALATWKPEFAKNPPAVREWFRYAAPTEAAQRRFGISRCCDHADRFMTKFVGRPGQQWSFYVDPNCTVPGCKLSTLPDDIVHEEPIRALDPKDNGLPEFEAMRREGVLFIYGGRPVCFWPPEGGI